MPEGSAWLMAAPRERERVWRRERRREGRQEERQERRWERRADPFAGQCLANSGLVLVLVVSISSSS